MVYKNVISLYHSHYPTQTQIVYNLINKPRDRHFCTSIFFFFCLFAFRCYLTAVPRIYTAISYNKDNKPLIRSTVQILICEIMRATSARMISRKRLLVIKLIICEAKLYYTIPKPEAKWIVKNKLSAATACAQKMRTISRSKVPSFRFSRRIESENQPIFLSAVTQSVFEENLPWNTVDFRNTFGRITRRRRRMARLALMRERCLEREIGNDSRSTVCGFEFFQRNFPNKFYKFSSRQFLIH